MISNVPLIIQNLRKRKPLVLCYTNFVTAEFVANCLLALGAAPIVSVCFEEQEELIRSSDVVYINIGTIDHAFAELVLMAASLAKKCGKPVVFDPVGAGASGIRTECARLIAPFSSIIRGNASEIMSMTNEAASTKGVDAAISVNKAENAAVKLAKANDITVLVSGEIDFITDGKRREFIEFGSSLMRMVTGMGCALTAVIAAFKTVLENSFEAAYMASSYFALCGEIAASDMCGIGTFKMDFINQLQNANFSLMKAIYDEKRISQG